MIVKLLGHNWRNLTNEHKSIIERANNSRQKTPNSNKLPVKMLPTSLGSLS